MSVTKMGFACIYVDELGPNKEFYERYLGFKQEKEFRPGEIFGKLGDVQCWMGSGYKRADSSGNIVEVLGGR